MPRLYATLAQVREYTGDQGLVLSLRELANASRFVEAATLGAVYDVDAAGLPTDPVVAAGFADAVCEVLALGQPPKPVGPMAADVAAMRANGIDSATVNGVTIKLAVATPMVTDGTQVPLTVRQILDAAGIRPGPVIVSG